MDEQAIQHFSESLSGLINYINWGSMLSFIATLIVTIKKLSPMDSSVDVKIIKNIKPAMFPIALIIITTIMIVVLNALAVSFFNEFSIKPYFYLYVNLGIFVIWFIIYFLLGFQSKLRTSLISYDMTEYQKHLYAHNKQKRKTELKVFSRVSNKKLLSNFKFNFYRKMIEKRYPKTKQYSRLKITILYRYIILIFIFLGSLINGFLIFILSLAGKDPMIILIYAFIILILSIQFFYTYNYSITMKNYDHLKHYRENNTESDKKR
ncbi:hypothetical protein ACY2C7_11375 [Staphylococcus cohnii]|nr:MULTISPECIES: hypothetical protein [Staphylococcus]MBA1352989.1 hypothetical protein [Staphylococcus cohnii]MBA1390606.1 hypothetical protein [Staphylococcus cohnii]MCE5033612.1 hypothetical protein [Staphylococcus cohnii]MCE5099703.1 hypothetical protein [Staphylococcus cohnii]MSU30450.1 hypothetical protein [Staphylococcus sp. McC-251-APC-3A2]